MTAPARPKIYHIVHWDRLPSIIANNCLWSHADVERLALPGTTIGYDHVKTRRKQDLLVSCHEGLQVGQCVPFNFCPRSVMLYVISMQNNPELTYRGGETPVVHLEADMLSAIEWADRHERRWAFTTSNAGERICDFYCDLNCLNAVDWEAVDAKIWTQVRGPKQAEFLIESSFPWSLVERIGIHPKAPARDILNVVAKAKHRPTVDILEGWYYGKS